MVRHLKLIHRIPAQLARQTAPRRLVMALIAAALGACGGGSASDPITVNGAVPVAFVMRANTVRLDPLTAGPGPVPGGDLMILAASSASAPAPYNVTQSITQGQGDAADPNVSYDGLKVVFALNCPSSNTSTTTNAAGATVPACTGHWNIWEYDMTQGGLTGGKLRRITDDSTCNIAQGQGGCDDVGPNYLPQGQGYVFSSSRQAGAYARQFNDTSQSPPVMHQYTALDEYEREQVFNIHTMDANGGNITQISFNQSHDRNPTVLYKAHSAISAQGSIMFSRWEHVADRNRFTISSVQQDGTKMFVFYGAHSDGNSYLHPREMDPNGKYAGYIASDLMPLDRTHGGGALMLIDTNDYADQNTPDNPGIPANGGQVQLTTQLLNTGTGPSLYGRITTPFPLWDGTDRFLISYTPCQVTNAGVVVSCATIPAAELAALSDTNRLNTQIAKDPVQDNVNPSYGIYMFDPSNQTMLPIASPPPGFMFVNPVALQARAEPAGYTPFVDNPTLAAQGLATLTVASVYDTDLLDRMGLSVLSASDLPAGCKTGIAQTAPTDPNDTRPSVADLNKIKDPANAAYNCSPVRFVRVVRAIAPPQGSTGERGAIGDTNFEQNEILGYVPVEPDGSFQINIPADTPVGFSVLDTQGRAFQVHTNWVQARAGEVRSCDGCHSPRNKSINALNSGPVVNTMAAGWNATIAGFHCAGDTMALTRARFVLNNSSCNADISSSPVFSLSKDLTYTDVWANAPTYAPRAAIQIDYSKLTTLAPVNAPGLPIIINYPDHVQPIWQASRTVNGVNSTCTSCHNASDTKLNLLATISGTGRMTSYEGLMLGSPVLDASGNPVIVVQDGNPVVELGPALVFSSASEGQATGLARQSRLIEILAGQTIMSDAGSQAAYPTPAITASVPDHSKMLNASEMRLVTEWVDLGGKYYNDPFVSASGTAVTAVSTLSEATFTAQVYPILMSTCAANCHMAKGSGSTVAPGTSFVDNKFVLTGSESGDFNNTLSMIADTCTPSDPANLLLSMPSTVPHPPGAQSGTAVLPLGSANYNIIANWIKSGCP
jgi:hypothetical protein